jgi:dTMP kinase
MAARRQLLQEVITPALALGRIVIADRYHDSTLAYQGGGRGVLVTWPPTFPRPDMTFLLALPVQNGRARQLNAGKSADRVESESIEFHMRVAAEYDRLAAAEPARFIRLDASESREAVHHKVMNRVGPAVEKLA